MHFMGSGLCGTSGTGWRGWVVSDLMKKSLPCFNPSFLEARRQDVQVPDYLAFYGSAYVLPYWRARYKVHTVCGESGTGTRRPIIDTNSLIYFGPRMPLPDRRGKAVRVSYFVDIIDIRETERLPL